MIVARREDAQVVRCCDSRGVTSLAVASRETVFRDSSLLNIVAAFGANKEAFVAECQVDGRNGALEEFDEGAYVDVRLLVVKVELAAVGAFRRQVVGEDLGFEPFGEVVFELELSVEAVGGGPCLG